MAITAPDSPARGGAGAKTCPTAAAESPPMLSLCLQLSDLSRPWIWHDGQWVSGQSWIRPFDHAVLSSSCRRGDTSILIEGRERREDGDFVTVKILRDRVSLTAGPHGTAPLYLTVRNGILHGSWSLPDLVGHTGSGQLLDRALTRMLTRRHRYSSDTLFTDIHRLTERATATAGPFAGLTIQYPLDAPHVTTPRQLRRDVDPVRAFDIVLTTLAARVSAPTDSTAIELSGGADSANVAVAVATARRDQIRSYGLLLAGEMGRHQQHRREAIVRHLDLLDTPTRATRHPPFTPTGARGSGHPHYPDGDVYHEAFDAARAWLAASGVHVVYTGFGGDEMVALRLTERVTPPPAPPLVPWLGDHARGALHHLEDNVAPASRVPPPSLMGFAARNPLFLERGLWPISPLADPVLVRFGESLPIPWRREKRLLRDRLRRVGFADDVAQPSPPESFTQLMQFGLRKHGLPIVERMLDDSILIDAGFVDHARLVAAYQHARTATELPDLLYDTIALEVGLASLTAARRNHR